MMNAAPGPINFTMFLTMFGDKLNGTDPEDVIKNAFACFDEDGKGMDFLLAFLCSNWRREKRTGLGMEKGERLEILGRRVVKRLDRLLS